MPTEFLNSLKRFFADNIRSLGKLVSGAVNPRPVITKYSAAVAYNAPPVIPAASAGSSIINNLEPDVTIDVPNKEYAKLQNSVETEISCYVGDEAAFIITERAPRLSRDGGVKDVCAVKVVSPDYKHLYYGAEFESPQALASSDFLRIYNSNEYDEAKRQEEGGERG